MIDRIAKERSTVMHDDGAAYHEIYRPQFHFTARTGWLNDPNGLVYHAGEYHLFFQHNPRGNNWGNMTWGHAVSGDLVHWRSLPSAIEPDRMGTIFSGSAVVDNDNTAGFQTGHDPALVAMYTAAGGSSPESDGQPFTQCLAYSNDRGRTWTKYAHNPVLPHIVGENRDPKVIWYAPGRFWVMSLFLDGESFALFTSPDLKRWTRIQTLKINGSECPDFFPLSVAGEQDEERWVFMAANGHYLAGVFDGVQFVPETGPLVLDCGANYYAMQTFSDIPAPDGRRVQIAWMAGGVYPDMPFNQQMSVPSVLTLHRLPEGLRLFRNPVVEIEALRSGAREWRGLNVAPGENPLSEIEGDLFDLIAEIDCRDAAGFGFRIRGEEIRYSAADRTLLCQGRSAVLDGRSESVRLRILIDRTSIEIFVNGGRIAMAFCFTPPPSDLSLEFVAEGSPVYIRSLELHTLRSIWTGDGAA
jgi:levanase/fructan beta-fructosidase